MTIEKNTNNSKNRIPVIAGVLTFFAVLMLLGILVRQQYRIYWQSNQRELSNAAHIAQEKMKWIHEDATTAMQTLSLLIENNNYEFDLTEIAPLIANSYPVLDAIAVIEGEVITQIYPPGKNESAIGFNVFKDSTHIDDLKKAMLRKELFFAGPYTLTSGDTAILARLPIHKNGAYWGFAVAIINLSTLQDFFNDYDHYPARFKYRFYKEKLEGDEQTLLDTTIFTDDNTAIVHLPGDDWKIETRFATSNSFAQKPTALILLGGLVAIIAGFVIWWLTLRPVRIQQVADLNESTLWGVFENAAVGMGILTPAGAFKKVNPAFTKILGYSQTEILQMSFPQIGHPDDIKKDLVFVENALKGNITTYHNEERCIHKNGSIVWVALNVVLIRDAANQPMHFVSQIEDITRKKEITAQLIEREEQLRVFAEHGPAAQVMLDNEMRYITMSDRYKQDYNIPDLPKEEIIGKYAYDLLPAFPDKWKAINSRSLAGSVEKSDEESYVTPDGQTHWITYEVRPWYKAANEIGGIIVFSESITKIKEAELKFRALVEKSMVGVYIIQNKTFSYINPRMAEIFGYTIEEMQGMDIETIIHPEYHHKINGILSLNNVEMESISFETKGITKQNNSIWIESFGSNTLYNGTPAVIGSLTDISYRKKAESEIREKVSQLQAITNNIPGVVIYQVVREKNGGRRFISTSRGIERITGLSAEETIAQQHLINNLIHRQDSVALMHAEEVSYQTMKPLQQEARFYTYKGEQLVVNIRAVPRLTEDGTVLWDGILTDITELKRSEQTLFHKNIEISERVKELNCLYRISQFAADSQLSEEEILNQCAHILPSAYRFAEKACTRIRYFEKEFVTGNFKETQWKQQAYMHVDNHNIGTIEVFYTQEVPDVKEGPGPFSAEEKSLINSVAEILAGLIERRTAEVELIESEQKFRSLVEQSLVGVIIIQLEKFVYVNAGFENIVGYNRMELLTRLTFDNIVHEEDLQAFKKLYADTLAGKISQTVTAKIIRRSGALRYIEVINNAIHYNGRPAIISTVIDITNRVQEEQRISKAVTNAQEQERFQIGMELHDNVNQMLTASNIHLGLVRKKVDDNAGVIEMVDQIKKYITDANSEIRHLSHQLAPSLDPIKSLTDKITGLIKNLGLEKQQINCSVEIEENKLEPYSNELQLAFYRILQEQFSNILKYAAASQISLTIKKTESTVILRLLDNGKGFDTSIKKEGIGLTNINRRAQSLGGRAEIISAPGKGCEVIVRIPTT